MTSSSSAPDPDGRLLTTAEVAAYLRVTPTALRRWRQRGAGPPAYVLGNTARYRVEDLEAWLESQRSSA